MSEAATERTEDQAPGLSHGGRADLDEEERAYRQLKAQIAMLDKRRIESRPPPEPSLRSERIDRGERKEPGFARAPLVIHDDSAFEPLACESEMDWFDSPARRWEARIQRIAIPAFAALAVLLGTGAVAAYLFASPEEPAAAMADAGAAGGEAETASEAVAVALAAPVAQPDRAGTPDASAAPADDARDADAPVATAPTTPEGGVTVLERRDAAPAPDGAPVEHETQASATRFGPLSSDAAAGRLPPRTIALPPPQLPTAVRANEPRPAAFAPPPPTAATVEPGAAGVPGTQAAAEEPAASIVEPAATAVEPETAVAEPEAGAVEPEVAGAAMPAPKPAGAAIGAARSSTASARVTTAVNMRAGPNNADPVITIVPAEAQVGVIECDIWCEVVFDGQRGWIYKSFVSRPAAAAGSG